MISLSPGYRRFYQELNESPTWKGDAMFCSKAYLVDFVAADVTSPSHEGVIEEEGVELTTNDPGHAMILNSFSLFC